MIIAFIEKDPYKVQISHHRMVLLPTYMIKDGKEYFVKSVTISGGNYSPEDDKQKLEAIKQQLISTNGAYDNPLDMLKEIEVRGHTFSEPHLDRLFTNCDMEFYGAGFVDFAGDRREVSAAFSYSVYDRSLVEELKRKVAALIGTDKTYKGGPRYVSRD